MKKYLTFTFLLVSLMVVFLGSDTPKISKVNSGILSYLDGKAQKTPLKVNEWKFLKTDDPVKSGEKVKTLEKSRAELKLDMGKTIRMAPLTQVDILKLYKEITQKGEKSDIKVKVSSGKIYSKIDALGDDESLEIETPLASATIRGTIFQVSSDTDTVQLDVIKGKVWVYSNNVEDPYKYFKENKGKHRINKPFKQIKKPYHKVTRGQWLEIIKSMQRITISKNGEKKITDLNKKDIDNNWIKWNEKLNAMEKKTK